MVATSQSSVVMSDAYITGHIVLFSVMDSARYDLIWNFNQQLFHKADLRCAKVVKIKNFFRTKSMLIATSLKWKRNLSKTPLTCFVTVQ